ncbi:hypothetical protein [Allokutzneria albata]|uniref:Uncharacterized protein n=1 Tax=Allokutzneria albata TaxID=211114 RepID=A0A1G9YXS4_ALLAB|nr:hypothetical protein [Allokutzneria albata]SDN13096.1 hypothetical protein SAMN04489726_5078 [Allokutzneria albata]
MARRKRQEQAAKPKPVTPFGKFAAWMGRKPQWPKVIGLVLLLTGLAIARIWVVPAYFTALDKIVGGNVPMAVVFGWLPGGGALIALGVYVLYEPFLGYRGKLAWVVVNTVWLALALMMMGAGVPQRAHPAFDYGLDAGQAAVPGIIVFGPLLILAVMMLAGLLGLFSKSTKQRLTPKRTNEEQGQLVGWGLVAAPLLFLAVALLTALT